MKVKCESCGVREEGFYIRVSMTVDGEGNTPYGDRDVPSPVKDR
jgi:hypothetical protein